jgi:hypothetical protein
MHITAVKTSLFRLLTSLIVTEGYIYLQLLAGGEYGDDSKA